MEKTRRSPCSERGNRRPEWCVKETSNNFSVCVCLCCKHADIPCVLFLQSVCVRICKHTDIPFVLFLLQSAH